MADFGMKDSSARDAARRSADRQVTVILLLTQVVVAILGYFVALLYGMSFAGCAERGSRCDYALGDLASDLARIGVLGVFVATMTASSVFMAMGRSARWIPAVGTALTIVVCISSLVLTRVAIS